MTDRLVSITTALAVVAVAGVAAIISYQHAYELVTSHGEPGVTAHLLPFTVDGLIWAASMVAQAERRVAAAGRNRKREAEQRRWAWRRRATVPVVTLVGCMAAAFTLGAVPAIGHVDRQNPLALYSLYVPPDPDNPDLPYLPEPDMTLYSAYDGTGTASTTTRVMAGETWDAWQWTQAR
jgi:hypothetical protein